MFLCKLQHDMGNPRGDFSGGPCILSWRRWYNDAPPPDPRTCSSFDVLASRVGGVPFRDERADPIPSSTPVVACPFRACMHLLRVPIRGAALLGVLSGSPFPFAIPVELFLHILLHVGVASPLLLHDVSAPMPILIEAAPDLVSRAAIPAEGVPGKWLLFAILPVGGP